LKTDSEKMWPLVFLFFFFFWRSRNSLSASALKGPVVVGINKYSHNACVCVVDATGRLVFAGEKERLSRVKNDGGAVGDLVRHALASCGADLGDVAAVAQQNHHAGVREEEEAYEACARVGLDAPANRPAVADVVDPANLLRDVPRVLEVSHHLAHAYGALMTPTADDDDDDREERKGGAPAIVVVLDGMGDRRSRFDFDDDQDDVVFVSDAGLDGWEECRHIVNDVPATFAEVPSEARECESVYETTFDGRLRAKWKRWCVARPSEPFAYADWFLGPMDSLGAAYSYASHVIFGDWNACGKVMGLAPWGLLSEEEEAFVGDSSLTASSSSSWGRSTRRSWGRLVGALDVDAVEAESGSPLIAVAGRGGVWRSGFAVDRSATRRILARASESLPERERRALRRGSGGSFPPEVERDLWNKYDEGSAVDGARACCAVLAALVQRQFEAAALPLIHAAADDAAPKAVYVTGGVALNSVFNGKIRGDFDVVVPPAPGDESVALGCAAVAFGSAVDASLLPFAGAPAESDGDFFFPPSSDVSFDFDDDDDQEGAAAAAPEEEGDDLLHEWLVPVLVKEEEEVVEACARSIASDGGIVFWFEGRSEFGPRALGHRSILASAADAGVVDYVNAYVKCREDFRPFAPAVLREAVDDVFDDSNDGESPYMSKVWQVKPGMRAKLAACTHVDGSARAQTVGNRPDLARYRALLLRVGELTDGPPAVLDTSFNTKKADPIVETRTGAVSSFVAAAARRPARGGGGGGEKDDQNRKRPFLLAFPEEGRLYRPAACPIDASTGHFPNAHVSRPKRRHDVYDVLTTLETIRVYDLDEPLEDAERTRRGDVPFSTGLDLDVYQACDGSRTAADLAADFGDAAYRSLRHLWLATLVTLG